MSDTPTPIHLVSAPAEAVRGLSDSQMNWLKANDFSGRAGQLLALPDGDGGVSAYVYGLGEAEGRNPMIVASAATQLPAGDYELVGENEDRDRNALAFTLGTYAFTLNKDGPEKDGPEVARLAGESVPNAEMTSLVEAAVLARDLINLPANYLGPDEFAARILAFAKQHKMKSSECKGEDLLKDNFPMIHAVGRASAEAPRLLDLTWGKTSHPLLTLVGKGVTFDTGGLDIKPAAGMALMKKDMGGAANILGLAHAIISNKLKVRLRVLIPVVENAISGSAFRPGDVLTARNGTTVEIGNTDAEGRLILADALAFAAEEEPDLVIDMATLTGAARVALGFDLPSLFSNSDDLADAVLAAGTEWGDPAWRMPLWQPYRAGMASKVADINHIASSPYAGATVAALFLEKFVEGATSWMHLDISGWSLDARPGRSIGGTDLGIRACYFALKDRFGQTG